MNSFLVELLHEIPLGFAVLILVSAVVVIKWVYNEASTFILKTKKAAIREYDESQTMSEVLSKLDELNATVNDFKSDMYDFRKEVEDTNSANNERMTRIEKKFDELDDRSDEQDRDLLKKMGDVEKTIDKVSDQVHLLIGSDKEEVEIFITSEYHKWMTQNEIDIYTLETIEKRYNRYCKLHEDTDFITALVEEMKCLKKIS